jgi:hypothetical protein
MMLDLIAFLFIIILSFILCMNNNNYNCQLTHIVIGLSVIVFYKLAKYYNLNKSITNITTPIHEPMTNSINDFISGTSISETILTNEQAKRLTPTELSSYNDKLNQLINVLNDIKNQQNSTPSNIAVSPNNLQKLDLDSQQQYQMFQIDYLNKQIQNAKDIINAQTIADSSTNYKPIKVYSSCIISNADGTTTLDKPIQPLGTQNNTNQLNNSSTQHMLQTIGQTNLQTGDNIPYGNSRDTGQFLNLAQSTGLFNNILNNLSKGNVNINI